MGLSTSRNKALAPSPDSLGQISICFKAQFSVLCSPGLSALGMHSGIIPLILHSVSMCFEIQGEKEGEVKGRTRLIHFRKEFIWKLRFWKYNLLEYLCHSPGVWGPLWEVTEFACMTQAYCRGRGRGRASPKKL